MFDHIPFEIQFEIIKRLLVKSLIQFRSVSKQWKAFIDNPEFIKNYHVNHTNPQHHLLVQYKLDTIQTYTSIIDNNTFPHQKFPLTAPESLSSLRHTIALGFVDGLLCFYGFGDVAVIWNPTIRKSVSIVIPKSGYMRTIDGFGFGVCGDTSDPKLVKINVDKISCMWVVDVFTLSTRVWKTVHTDFPFKSCGLACLHICVNGVIYFRAYDDEALNHGSWLNFVISFDLKSEKFGEVSLLEKLVHAPSLVVAKVNESLNLLEYCDEGDVEVCGVWTREDGANKIFSKIYTVKVLGKSLLRVLEFRNNGEVVIELMDDNYMESRIEVYEQLSRHTIGDGINGKRHTIFASLYAETLLLLDQN